MRFFIGFKGRVFLYVYLSFYIFDTCTYGTCSIIFSMLSGGYVSYISICLAKSGNSTSVGAGRRLRLCLLKWTFRDLQRPLESRKTFTSRLTLDENFPIGSMYGIYANIWGILMINVTIYSIHGSYGFNPLVFWYQW